MSAAVGILVARLEWMNLGIAPLLDRSVRRCGSNGFGYNPVSRTRPL